MLNFFKKLFSRGPAVNFKELIEKGAAIIDVRTPEEYVLGHGKDAIIISLQTIGKQINTIKQMNKPVITVCRSGSMSGIAAAMLKRAGIEVYNGGSWNVLANKLSSGEFHAQKQ